MKIKKNDLLFYLFVVFIVTIAILPVLLNPVYCILDYPLFGELAQNINLFDKSTYLNISNFITRAGYGYLLYWFPCYFSVDPIWRVLFHSWFLLLVSSSCVFYFVNLITKRKWLALLTIIQFILNSSFT